jgi:hypothetical protein
MDILLSCSGVSQSDDNKWFILSSANLVKIWQIIEVVMLSTTFELVLC